VSDDRLGFGGQDEITVSGPNTDGTKTVDIGDDGDTSIDSDDGDDGGGDSPSSSDSTGDSDPSTEPDTKTVVLDPDDKSQGAAGTVVGSTRDPDKAARIRRGVDDGDDDPTVIRTGSQTSAGPGNQVTGDRRGQRELEKTEEELRRARQRIIRDDGSIPASLLETYRDVQSSLVDVQNQQEQIRRGGEPVILSEGESLQSGTREAAQRQAEDITRLTGEPVSVNKTAEVDDKGLETRRGRRMQNVFLGRREGRNAVLLDEGRSVASPVPRRRRRRPQVSNSARLIVAQNELAKLQTRDGSSTNSILPSRSRLNTGTRPNSRRNIRSNVRERDILSGIPGTRETGVEGSVRAIVGPALSISKGVAKGAGASPFLPGSPATRFQETALKEAGATDRQAELLSGPSAQQDIRRAIELAGGDAPETTAEAAQDRDVRMAGLAFGIGLGSSALPATLATGADIGITAAGLTQVGRDISKGDTTSREVTSGIVEVAPFVPGAVRGARRAAREGTIRLVAKKRSQTEVFDEDAIQATEQGDSKLPKASSTDEAKQRFQATTEENSEAVVGSTASPQPISGDTAGSGRKGGTLEDPGIYVTPRGEGSPYFLRLNDQQQRTEFSLNPFRDDARNPTVTEIRAPKGVQDPPEDVASQPGFKELQQRYKEKGDTGEIRITKRSQIGQGERQAQEFQVDEDLAGTELPIPQTVRREGENIQLGKGDKLQKGDTLTESGTSEIEGVVPQGQSFKADVEGRGNFAQRFLQRRLGFDEYTTVQGRAVPIRKTTLRTDDAANAAKTADNAEDAATDAAKASDDVDTVSQRQIQEETSSLRSLQENKRVRSVDDLAKPSSGTSIARQESPGAAETAERIQSLSDTSKQTSDIDVSPSSQLSGASQDTKTSTSLSTTSSDTGSTTSTSPSSTTSGSTTSSGGSGSTSSGASSTSTSGTSTGSTGSTSSGSSSTGSGTRGGSSTGEGTSTTPPTTPPRKPRGDGSRGKQEFTVQVKRDGELKDIATAPTLSQAQSKGRRRTDQSLAATYRVLQGDGSPADISPGQGFRKSESTPGGVVEQEEKRLDTQQEIFGINQEKQAKGRGIQRTQGQGQGRSQNQRKTGVKRGANQGTPGQVGVIRGNQGQRQNPAESNRGFQGERPLFEAKNTSSTFDDMNIGALDQLKAQNQGQPSQKTPTGIIPSQPQQKNKKTGVQRGQPSVAPGKVLQNNAANTNGPSLDQLGNIL